MIRKEDIYNVIPKDVLLEIFENFELDIKDGIHGFYHWSRVIDNGLYIAKNNNANKNIIIAFGIFHDIKRENDDEDPEHGYRGGLLIEKYKNKINLNENELKKTIEACSGHTNILHHSDLDISTCWDADRLDLYRVGVYPNAEYLNNEFSKKENVIRERSILALDEEIPMWAYHILKEVIEPMLKQKELNIFLNNKDFKKNNKIKLER